MMAENDSDMIRPVEAFQGISGPTQVKRDGKKRRRQRSPRRPSGRNMNEQHEPADVPGGTGENQKDQLSIDYRA